MIRRILIVSLSVLLAVLLLAAGGIFWLVGTGSGARWLLTTVPDRAGVRISFKHLEGRLLDDLKLEGLQLRTDTKQVTAGAVQLSWKLPTLLSGRLEVDRLYLSELQIVDSAPPSKGPVDLPWPKVSGYARLLEADVKDLRISGLVYRSRGKEPVRINAIRSSLSWRTGVLRIERLELDTPEGTATGKIAAGLVRPSLRSDLSVAPKKPLGGMDRLRLQADLAPGSGREQVSGRITLSGASGGTWIAEVSGEVGMTRDSFVLRRVGVKERRLEGSVFVDGIVSLNGREPLLDLKLTAAGVNLEKTAGKKTRLSGLVTVVGDPERYRGRFDLRNRGAGWQEIRLAGIYSGDRNSAAIRSISGGVLSGTVNGRVDLNWRKGITASAVLQGRGLDPSLLDPKVRGSLNPDLKGTVHVPPSGVPSGQVDLVLNESVVHEQALTGEAQARFTGNDIELPMFRIFGEGFSLRGNGNLNRQLNFAAEVADISDFYPGVEGSLAGTGWVSRRNGRWAGAAEGEGADLGSGTFSASGTRFSLRYGQAGPDRLQGAVDLRDVKYGRFAANWINTRADGTLASHRIGLELFSPDAELLVSVEGGYRDGSWRGDILRLDGHDTTGPWTLQSPAQLALQRGRVSLSPLLLAGEGGEQLQLSGELDSSTGNGLFHTEWRRINLVRANNWIEGIVLSGTSEGAIDLRTSGFDAADVKGSASFLGGVVYGGKKMPVESGTISLNGGKQGMEAEVSLQVTGGGTVRSRFDSPLPMRPAVPEQGRFAMQLSSVDVRLAREWYPDLPNVSGFLDGHAEGRLHPGRRFELNGSTNLLNGMVNWRQANGEMTASLRTAGLSWTWRDDALDGSLELVFAEHGRIYGDLRLPLAARFPLRIDRETPLAGRVTGQFRERGMLSSFMPGIVQESHGDIAADIGVAGTIAAPLLNGRLQLSGAGGHVPASGITIRDVSLSADIENNRVVINSFSAASGEGRLTGNAEINLEGFKLRSYSGTVRGQAFQFVHLPELTVAASPDLNFAGTASKIIVRGDLFVPELLVLGQPVQNVVEPSPDVVLVGEKPEEPKTLPLEMDVRVLVRLGDRVLVKTEGIDARLGGSMEISMAGLDRITSKGEINVVKGNYRTYGVDLSIERGRFFYAGGPVNRPTMDILALRTAENDVKAGVTVAGVPQAPVVKLYSEPPMPDVDILGYIVLGHPIGAGTGEQAGLMASAAGALLSAGQSVVLQDQIMQRLGLSTLEITSGKTEESGLMGYKPIEVTPTGAKPRTVQTGALTEAMFTVGKYLTPELYISYGRSLFTGANLFRIRYDISRRLQIQTETGTESGADIYYKIDFD